MSGFDPLFSPASGGTRDGSVPAPGAIDGRTFYLRADRTWAVPVGNTPGPPPPPPGPALNQWACNIAGYLTYEVARIAVKLAVDWVPVSWIGDIVGGISAGVIRLLLAEDPIIAAIISDMVFHFVSDHIVGLASGALTALLDDVLWAKVHCALYGALADSPTDFLAALTAAAGVVGAFLGYPAPATAAIAYFLQHLGITDVANIPITAFIQNYDCSTCAVTGIGPQKPLLQTSFDLTVSDGTTADTFVDSIQFAHATVSGTSPHAILTPNTTNSTSLGISKPDGTTIGVDSGGTYSVLEGQLASVQADQAGAFAVTVESGITISGLVVGNTYAIQSRGGPWYFIAGTAAPVYDWDVSVNGGATWDTVYWDNGGHRPTAGPLVVVPAWALSGRITGAHHARIVFVATTTSIKVRVYDTPGDYGDNHGSLWWELLDVVIEPAAFQLLHNGTAVGARPTVNLVDSADVTISAADNDLGDRVDVTLATAAHGTVTGVSVTAPVTSSGGTSPSIGLTTPLAMNYGGTGIDTSGVNDGDLLVGTGAHVWSLGGIGGGDGITVSKVGSIYTVASNIVAGTNIAISISGGVLTIDAASGGAGGTALTKLGTGNGGGSTIDFTSIPNTYSHLQLWCMLKTTHASAFDSTLVRANNDSTTNYDAVDIWANTAGSSGADTGITGQTSMNLANVTTPGTSNTFDFCYLVIDIPFYASTVAPKRFFARASLWNSSGGSGSEKFTTGIWRTAGTAISRVTLIPSAGNWDSSSQAILYGVS